VTSVTFCGVIAGPRSGRDDQLCAEYALASLGLSLTLNSMNTIGTYASWFARTTNCPVNLNLGAPCAIGMTFTPQAAASKSAKLTNATSATITPLSVSLSGTGVLPP